jgi:hypothetical protein
MHVRVHWHVRSRVVCVWLFGVPVSDSSSAESVVTLMSWKHSTFLGFPGLVLLLQRDDRTA